MTAVAWALAVGLSIAAWLYRRRWLSTRTALREADLATIDAMRAVYTYRSRMESAESALAAKIAKDAELSNETASFELADGGFVTLARYDIRGIEWISGPSVFTEVRTDKDRFKIVCPPEDFLAWARGEVSRT
jgi:hypothetical protein